MDLRLRIEVESFQAEAKLRALNAEVQQLERQLQKGAITQQQYEATFKRISVEAGATRQQLATLKNEQQKLTTSTVATTGAQQALIGTIMRFVGPAAIGLAIKSTVTWASNLSDLSKKTGINVESLQRLEHAAAKNGSSIQALSSTIAMLADRIGSGDKSAVAAVKKLGLDFDRLKGQSPERTFIDLAQALSKVPSHYEKVALAQDIFGRGARELIPLLDDVAKAMSEDIPVASQETIAALDRMEDWWQSLKLAVKAGIAEMLGFFLRVGQAVEDFKARHPWLAKLMQSPSQLTAETFATKGIPSMMGPTLQEGGVARGPGMSGMMPEPLSAITAPWDAAFKEIERDLDTQARATREAAAATQKAVKAELQLTEARERAAWTAYQSSLRLNPPTPAGWALPTPGFTVAGPQAGNPWASLFGGTGGGTNTWFQTGFGGPTFTPGWSGPLPGQPLTPGQIIGAKPPGAWGQLGGSLMNALPSVLMSAFTGGGNVGQSVGGLFGGQMGSWVSGLAGGGVGKALGGIMGSILPGIGTLLGGALGGLFGKLFGPSEATKTKRARNAWLEQAGGLAEVRKMAEYAGVSIDKLLSTKKTKTFEAEVKKLEAAFKATQERVQKLTSDLTTLGQSGGLLTGDMAKRIKADLSKPEIQQAFADFISTNLERAGTALTDFVTKSAALPLTEQSARGLGAAFAGVYQQLVAMGASGAEALAILQPGIDALAKRLLDVGLSGGEAFAELQAMAALASDAVAGPLLEAVNDIGNALVALQNTGILTQEMFADLASTVGQTFDKLIAEGKDSRLVMILMQKPLQQLWELMHDFGYEVDDATRRLIDQAEEAGLVGDKFRDAQKQMIEALNKLIDRFDVFLKQLGVELPEEAERGARGAQRAIDGIHPPRNESPEHMEAQGAEQFQHGSGGVRDFGTGTWAILHGREAVLTEAQLRARGGGVVVNVDARGALLGDASSQAQLATIISDAVLRRTSLLARA